MVYSINATERDQTFGWANITPTHHHKHDYFYIAEDLWTLANYLIDYGEEKHKEKIEKVQKLATEFETMAREDLTCTCQPNAVMVCRVCQATLDYQNINNDDEFPY